MKKNKTAAGRVGKPYLIALAATVIIGSGFFLARNQIVAFMSNDIGDQVATVAGNKIIVARFGQFGQLVSTQIKTELEHTINNKNIKGSLDKLEVANTYTKTYNVKGFWGAYDKDESIISVFKTYPKDASAVRSYGPDVGSDTLDCKIPNGPNHLESIDIKGEKTEKNLTDAECKEKSNELDPQTVMISPDYVQKGGFSSILNSNGLEKRAVWKVGEYTEVYTANIDKNKDVQFTFEVSANSYSVAPGEFDKLVWNPVPVECSQIRVKQLEPTVSFVEVDPVGTNGKNSKPYCLARLQVHGNRVKIQVVPNVPLAETNIKLKGVYEIQYEQK